MFLMFQFFLFVPWLAEFYYNLIQQQGCSLCQDENAIYQPVLICDICANHLIKVKSGHKSSTSRSSHWRRENLWWRMVLRWLHDWPSTHTGMHVLLGFAQKSWFSDISDILQKVAATELYNYSDYPSIRGSLSHMYILHFLFLAWSFHIHIFGLS